MNHENNRDLIFPDFCPLPPLCFIILPLYPSLAAMLGPLAPFSSRGALALPEKLKQGGGGGTKNETREVGQILRLSQIIKFLFLPGVDPPGQMSVVDTLNFDPDPRIRL